MGPGDRVQFDVFRGIAFGIRYDRWPYTRSITLTFLCFSIFVGLGSAYTDPDYKY